MAIFVGKTFDHWQDLSVLKEEFNKIQQKYPELDKHNIEVKYEGRMTVSSGRCTLFRKNKKFKISLSKKARNQFGIEDTVKTFRHEIAHILAYNRTGKLNHCEIFKMLCVELGGDMNSQLAGVRYAANSTSNYCESRPRKYEYRCPGCGQIAKRARRISERVKNSHSCITCETPVRHWTLKVIK